MIDMQRLQFIQAKWFTPIEPTQPRHIYKIVIHDMEAKETLTTAEDIAMYFHTLNEKLPNGSPKKASAHTCWDVNSAVRCVLDKDVAYAAPGANNDGLQYELAGFGRQTRDEWLDDYGKSMIALVCEGVAQDCLRYGIPPAHLTNAQLADPTSKGIIGHFQASQVWHKSDHTDPGPGFPWDIFLTGVQTVYATLTHPNSAFAPKVGDRRYSPSLKSYLSLVSYVDDKHWTFRVERPVGEIITAGTAWSALPLHS